MNSAIVVRPATSLDYQNFYGESPPYTMRAICGELPSGQIIAIGGLLRQPDGNYLIFSDIKPEARNYPIAIVKAARQIAQMAEGLPAVAIPWEEHKEEAERLLAYLGFAPIPNGGYMLRGKIER